MSDEYYTPNKVWDSIIDLLPNEPIVVYEPFFGKGHTFDYLKQQGQLTLGEKDQDFFSVNSLHMLKHCDCVISNPPFSIKYEILEQLVDFNIPFVLLFPLQSTTTIKFRECFDDEIEHVTMIIPKGRIKYITANDEIKSPNFDSCFICYKMFDKQLIFLDMQ